MGYKKKIKRTHRRRAKMRLGAKGGRSNGTRDHNRPRPNGKKIRVKHW